MHGYRWYSLFYLGYARRYHVRDRAMCARAAMRILSAEYYDVFILILSCHGPLRKHVDLWQPAISAHGDRVYCAGGFYYCQPGHDMCRLIDLTYSHRYVRRSALHLYMDTGASYRLTSHRIAHYNYSLYSNHYRCLRYNSHRNHYSNGKHRRPDQWCTLIMRR